MHVSHLFEDVEAWYLNFDFRERVDTAFRPGLDVRDGHADRPQGPRDAELADDVKRDFATHGPFRPHSASIQTSSRLQQDHVADDGTVYKRGTAIPQRADFNTLDNPFAWSARPDVDDMQAGPRRRPPLRRLQPDERRLPSQPAGDGRPAAGRDEACRSQPRDRNQGFNAVLRTTHRQNFLVPPRVHRSFPLAELRRTRPHRRLSREALTP